MFQARTWEHVYLVCIWGVCLPARICGGQKTIARIMQLLCGGTHNTHSTHRTHRTHRTQEALLVVNLAAATSSPSPCAPTPTFSPTPVPAPSPPSPYPSSAPVPDTALAPAPVTPASACCPCRQLSKDNALHWLCKSSCMQTASPSMAMVAHSEATIPFIADLRHSSTTETSAPYRQIPDAFRDSGNKGPSAVGIWLYPFGWTSSRSIGTSRGPH